MPAFMKQYYTGCSGFSYREWKHYFYPDTLPVKDWFSFYAQHFNTVEINASFYNLPKLALLKRWWKLSPPDFRFTMKAPRTITHFKKFKDIGNELEEFYQLCVDGLEEKLGCILFQLPPAIHFDGALLDSICTQLSNNYQNVIEFRHSSWWQESVYQKLRASNITFCSVSYPGLPTTIVQTSNVLYTRLHGVPKLYYSAYSTDELKLVTAQIKQCTADTAYTYFNNTAALEAISNARLQQAFLTGERQ